MQEFSKDIFRTNLKIELGISLVLFMFTFCNPILCLPRRRCSEHFETQINRQVLRHASDDEQYTYMLRKVIVL